MAEEWDYMRVVQINHFVHRGKITELARSIQWAECPTTLTFTRAQVKGCFAKVTKSSLQQGQGGRARKKSARGSGLNTDSPSHSGLSSRGSDINLHVHNFGKRLKLKFYRNYTKILNLCK